MKKLNPTAQVEDLYVWEITDPFGPHVVETPAQNLLNRIAQAAADIQNVANAGVAEWTQMSSSSDYDDTAPTTTSIAGLRNLGDDIRPGDCVRVFVTLGALYEDTSSQISGWAVTGLTSAFTSNGLIWIDVIDDGGGYFHIAFYNNLAKSAADLIAHTATYNSTGAKTLVPDNGSGIGGTISVGSVGPADSMFTDQYKHYIVTNVTGAGLDVIGPSLPTGANELVELWRVDPARVFQLELMVPGTYADGASSTLLASIANTSFRWRGPMAKCVAFAAWAKTRTNSHRVNITIDGNKVCDEASDDGLSIAASATWYETDDNLNHDALRIQRGNAIEITTTDAGAVGDENLTVSISFVIE